MGSQSFNLRGLQVMGLGVSVLTLENSMGHIRQTPRSLPDLHCGQRLIEGYALCRRHSLSGADDEMSRRIP